ncbi:MAG: hypothetical protein OXD50_05630 [Chloroflexi bacterium]|nr:hypothetical protein [Chloroflexota bacterium]
MKILRTHVGEEDAIAAADALQDEFAETTTQHDIQMLMVWMRAEMSSVLLGGLLGASTIAGIALAVAKLT